MARQKTSARKSELLPRSGIVTVARIDMHIYADKQRGSVRERKSSIHIDVMGEFTEPVSGITKFSILTHPVPMPAAGQAEIPCIGSFTRFKPIAQGVVELSVDEFQNLMLLATSGKLRSCYVAFNTPYRGHALIVSVSFSSGPPEE